MDPALINDWDFEHCDWLSDYSKGKLRAERVAHIRNQALEEAAKVAEDAYPNKSAELIRSLMGRPNY